MEKFKTIITSIITIIIMTIFLGQGAVNAAVVKEKVNLNVQYKRIVSGSDKGAYAFNNDYKITQIFSGSGTSRKTNYFCTNAAVSWAPGQTVEYDTYYDLNTDKTAISGLVSSYSNVTGSKYTQILWLLDNYDVGSNYDVKTLLAKAGIVEDDGIYYYDSSVNPNSVFSKKEDVLVYYGNPYKRGDGYGNVIMSKDLIEAVKQAALWYFTNNGDSHYNFYTKESDTTLTKWLKYSSDGNNWTLLAESGTHYTGTEYSGGMLQEQASILYNYYIDKANAAASAGYSNEKGTLTLTYTGASNKKMVKDGTKYKIGPLKATTTGNATITGVEVTSGTSTTAITGVTLQNAGGTTISKPTSGSEFYVLVDESKINGNATVKVTGKTATISKKYRIRATNNNSTAVQGVVEVTPTTETLQATVTTALEFDLALRKVITGVTDSTGNTVSLKNENGYGATRTLNIDKSTIPNTATYKHRKDPIVVSEGDIITYKLKIYNEGEIDGYASQIVDQLPTGLIPANLVRSGTSYLPINVTSSKGNLYGGVYDEERNCITYTLYNENPTSIPAYNGTLESDEIEVKCEVKQKAATDGTTKHYLTNIAYISAECDKNGNVISQDRDSSTSASPSKQSNELNSTNVNSYKGNTSNQSVMNDTNNNYYYEGEQDDDDFEKVVVMPKEFDLKLLKYISAINGNSTTRTITVDKTNLNKTVGGKRITTANYNVSKVPLTVEKGDFVTYTFRIYNEGEISGYASEITEDIPEGLEYVAERNTNPAWVVAGNGKTIKTNYLADKLINAYDGSTLDYKEVSVVLKVVTDDTTKIIRNEAEISQDKDANGNDVTDRDSTPEEWKKENSTTDFYENNDKYPKYVEDDEDYDNIRLATIDLALRKFITKISKDGNFSSTTTTTSYNREPQVNTSKLKTGAEETAIYNHSKEQIYLNVGDYVLYTIRVYNEGEAAGYASKIADYLPTYLDFVAESSNTYIKDINDKWSYDSNTRVATTKSEAANTNTKLDPFDKSNDNGKGSGLSSVDVQIVCKVNGSAPESRKLTNIAEITEYKNKNAEVITKDIDSEPSNFPTNLLNQDTRPDYNGGADADRTDNYVPGQQDDDDFEKVILRGPSKYNVILIKEDKDGEELDSQATFEVNGVTKNVIGHLTVAENVEINGSNVNTPDVYTIKETKAPDEYCEFNGTITITANKEETDTSYKLKDLQYSVKDPSGREITSENSDIYLKDGNIYVEVINFKEPEIHKGVKTVENQDSGYNINEEQNWVITSDIPEDITTYKKYEITDAVDYRLNFSGIDKVEVKIGSKKLTAGTDYKINYIKNENGITDKTNQGTLKLTFVDTENSISPSTNLKDNKGKKIEITFKTTFAKDSSGKLLAELGTEIPNKAKLEYKNSTDVTGDKESETPEIHTGGVTLFKYYLTGTDKKALEGAEFAIYKSRADAEAKKDAVQTATSDANGIVKFIGLEYGEDANSKEENKTAQGTYKYDSSKQSTKYWIAETKAPTKYETYKEIIEVTINATSYTETVAEIKYQVENEKKPFDLKLLKYISSVNDKTSNRKITVDTTNLNKTINGKKVTTANYDVTKVPLNVQIGDFVTYTFRVYNEGEISGYATEITEDIPEGLEYVAEKNTNPAWEVSQDGKTIKTNYLADKLIRAYDGNTLDYKEVSVVLKVVSTDVNKIIRNEAEISNDKDEDGEDVTDRDSTPEEWKKENSEENYEDNKDYPKYKEDDEDYDNIIITNPDLSLRKFIDKVSSDGNFKDTKSTVVYNREPEVDSSKLKDRSAQTAIYKHSKKPVSLFAGDYVLYTIRAYNEGEVAGYASQIIDYLPDYLDFVESTDTQIQTINDNWTYDSSTRKVTTKATAPNATKLLKAFDKQNDNGKGSGLYYVDVQIVCRINKNVQANKKLTNIAEISEYKNENNIVVEKDRDSNPENINYPDNPSTYKDDELDKEYVPGQEDDDDFEKIIIKEPRKFDLALRKFITEIEGKEITSRIPQLSYQNGKIIYSHPKDVVKLAVGNTVIYTLRVYNEGDIAGFAEKVSDDIPEHLEYLPENATNKEYRWKMYDKDGKETSNINNAVRIVTDYTSKANGEALMKAKNLKENPNLLDAFREVNPPDYVDVKVAFKVKDPGSNKIIITNKAQISEDADEEGKEVKDIDSNPDIWKDGEDDQDYENVSVEYFDLSLLKYVTKAIVTENGKTKTTKTGNTGSSKDITPKVEIYRKNVNTTIVKFEYVIKITNEGDIAGYAKEITDYVPAGLKFYKEDNQGWTDEGNNVISTKLLQNTLLQPGESATVKVILRWINGSNNLGVKINTAEISEDYNEKNVPDRDSTPDNKKPGEDDIDDAPVLLTISTGEFNKAIQIATGSLIVLVVLGLGVAAIRKYVL